jgi:hypothetical protein
LRIWARWLCGSFANLHMASHFRSQLSMPRHWYAIITKQTAHIMSHCFFPTWQQFFICLTITSNTYNYITCQYCRRGTPPIILINSVKTQLEAIHLHVSDHHSCKNNALEVAIHTDKQTKRHATQVYLVSCVECYCIYKESVQHSDSSRCQVLDPPFTIGLHPEHGLGVLGS